MKVTVKNGVLSFRCKISKKQTFKVMENSKYKSIYIFNRPQVVKGFTNETEDNMSVLYIDYDNCDRNVIESDYKIIQEKYKLPQSYLFQTKENNYHVICLKKFMNGIIPQILLMTRCDANYTFSPSLHRYKSYVLRLSEKRGSKKPKFKEMIGEMKNLNYEISKAHLELLQKIYSKLPHVKYMNIDKGKTIKTQIYETSVGGD